MFGDPVLDLEYMTLRHLENLAEAIKTALIEEGMVQMPESLVAHFCAYLGYLSVYTLGLERATALEKPLGTLVRSQAQEAFTLFEKYPVNSGEKQQKHDNLEQCRSQAPGSIIVQTLRFGRCLFDMIEELGTERRFRSGNQSKQTEMFCSIDRLMVIFRQHADDLRKESTEAERDMMLDINQTAIQLGYLMGYYDTFHLRFPKRLDDPMKQMIWTEVNRAPSDSYRIKPTLRRSPDAIHRYDRQPSGPC